MHTAASKKAQTQKVIEAGAQVASYTGLPIPGRVPGMGNMFMQAYPDVMNQWMFNTVDYLNNKMNFEPRDLMHRRPVKERHY